MAIKNALHEHEDVARVFRALSEPSRLTLIHCLANGPHRVGELSAHLGLAQSTVSAHLAVLRDAGLVAATPDGRATLYRLAHAGLDDLLHAGERLIAPDTEDASRHGHHDESTSTPPADEVTMGRTSEAVIVSEPVMSA